jgi:cytochrome c oxidase subunit IV
VNEGAGVSDTDVRGAPDAHGDAEHRPSTRRRTHGAHPSPKEYIRIAIVLFVITVMEVSTYYLDPPRSVLIPVLFVFTIVKFALVVMWFMHLKFDSRIYSRFFVMGIAFAVTLYIVTLMMFGAFTSGSP